MKVPAPIGGLNYRDAQNRLPPTDAKTLDNWIPDSGYCRIRESGDEKADLGGSIAPACSPYNCSSLRDGILALGGWPFDDPQRGNVPATVYAESAPYTLSPNSGVGGNWISGTNREWNPLADFCDGSDGSDDGTRWRTLYSGESRINIGGMTTVEQMQTTYTHVLRSQSSTLLADFVYTLNGVVTRNPRLRCNIGTEEADFVSSFGAGNPEITIPVGDNPGDIHVVTIEIALSAPYEISAGNWRQLLTWIITVDDNDPVELEHESETYTTVGQPVVDNLTRAALYRADDGLIAGLVFGVPHYDVYLLALQNYSGYEQPGYCND